MASLYEAVITSGTDPACQDDVFLEKFEKSMKNDGILPHVFNAMATVLGGSTTHTWRLWETRKVEDVPDQGTGYAADDQRRYFFEYAEDADTGMYNRLLLEYARADSFELRGTRFLVTGPTNMVMEQTIVKQAMVAMLLAILKHEATDSTFVTVAGNFNNNYKTAFTRDYELCYGDVYNLYGILKKVVNPINIGEDSFFRVARASLQSNNLTRVLKGETVGYVDPETGRIHLAAGMAATLLLQSSQDPPDHVLPDPLVVMPTTVTAPPDKIPESIRKGMYAINPFRVYDSDERSRLLDIPDWYVPSEQIRQIGLAVHQSRQFQTPFRNLMFRGPAGTGKTEGAKALACMFGLPYGTVTCFSEMELFDFTSSMVPRTDEDLGTPQEMSEYLRHALREHDLNIPSCAEIAAMPDAAYYQITGERNDDATEQDCFIALTSHLIQIVKQDGSLYQGEKSKFKVVRSDFSIGIEKGWLVEIQELNVIEKPGVMVGLNSVMEHGKLHLPSGETITRHPDAIIIFTQNVGYAGTTDVNQSVLSRINLKSDFKEPGDDELMERVRKQVPLPRAKIQKILTAARRIRVECKAQSEYGNVGTREIINWAKMAVLMGSIKQAAEYTIIPSCSENPNDQTMIRTTVINNMRD